MSRKQDERLAALRALGVLDTPSEPRFDRLAALAADLFEAPIALISLVDDSRQWSKARVGLEVCSTDRSLAFCAHAIELGPEAVMVVEDATLDSRFAANPQVIGAPHIRFYAGAALTTAEGLNLGTLCVIDNKPRPRPSDAELNRLLSLAKVVIDELELSRQLRVAGEKEKLLELAETMSGVGHWRVDLQADLIQWSDVVYAIHGVDRESFDPNLDKAVNFFHPDDRAKVSAHIAAALESKRGYAFDLRLVRPDGEIRNVLSKAVCELDGAGAVSALFGVFQDITDHKRSLEAVRLGKARYRLLADHAGDVITRFDLQGRGRYVSPAIHSLLGYRPSETAGSAAANHLHPDDIAPVTAAFADLAQGLAERTIEHRSRHRLGHYVWVESNLQLVRDAEGAPSEVIAVSRDVSQRKALTLAALAARDEAREQAQRALLAEEIAGVGYWRVELASGAVALSPKMLEIYGLDPASAPSVEMINAMLVPEDRPVAEASIRRQLRTGEAVTGQSSRIIRADGVLRYLKTSAMIERDQGGAMKALVGTVTDVSAEREAELAIADSERRYRLIAENVSDIIANVRLDSTVEFITPSVRTILGYTPEEMIGRRTLALTHPDDVEDLTRAFAPLLRGEFGELSQPTQYRGRHKDGHWVWLEGQPRPLFDSVSGQLVGFQDVVRDITLRKAHEAALTEARVEAEASVLAKTEFLANMSHELRTPLTAVLGFSRLIVEQPELSSTTRRFIDRVVNAGKALLASVNDILDFSRLEAGQVEIKRLPAAPAAVLRDAVDLFAVQAADKGLKLEVIGIDSLPPCALIDADRLRQVLLNLVGNAVKFTEVGGVRLEAGYDQDTQALGLVVNDSGAGISPDRQGLLFQRFSQVDGSSTREHGGTGLGLAICKGLVEAMGGQIGMTSIKGLGSRFWVSIPAPRLDGVGLGAARGGPPAVLRPGCRILVADDNQANLDIAGAVLGALGAEVSTVADGHAALAAASQPFDAILMDLRMPGIGGEQAAALIRAGDGPNRTAPIFAFSADVTYDPSGGLFDGLIAKPIDAADLMAQLAAALSLAPGDHVG